MDMTGKLRTFLRDENGASAIEFVILAPMLIMALLGVMQVGFYMQAQNALASIATDMSRFMSVEYQRDNKITNTLLENRAYSRAIGAPYLLQPEGISVSAKDASTQTINNVREIELELGYKVPNVMAFASFGPMDLTYKKSIFVPN